MVFFSHMVNAWSLLGSIVSGTFEEDYPILDKSKGRWSEEDEIRELDDYYDFKNVGAGNTAHEDDGLDYEIDLTNGASADYNMADIDDMYYHHYTNANSSFNDGWTQEYHQEQLDKMAKTGNVELNYQPQHAHFYKYHEEEILKDIEEYVSSTYQGHYTGKSHEYRNVQTIDLMASKELAAGFCQANILKYGSRYGNKDGKNKKDLMKVIHYAMLLLHFDNHYGEPSMPSGNFEQMP